mgnify:FL=1
MADFSEAKSILEDGLSSGIISQAEHDFLSGLLDAIESDINQSTDFQGMRDYINQNRNINIFDDVKDEIDMMGVLIEIAESAQAQSPKNTLQDEKQLAVDLVKSSE